ncbi:MAG: hypothetical protein V4864_25305 [Pseudomonadota bacterium]
MQPRRLIRALAFSAVACCASFAGMADAAAWRPVPGAQEVEIDITSIRQTGARVTAWLRWPGRPPHALPVAGVPDARQPRIARTAVLTEFDCSGRSMRALAANAYDSGGAPASMSSVPGPVLPVRGDDTLWAYDAACEAARSGGRF